MRHKRLVILLQQFGFTLIFLGIVLFLLTLLSNDLASLAEFVRYPAFEIYLPLILGWVHLLFKAILIGISLAGGAQILVLLKQRREKRGENK
jgi:hypothetical protein